MILAHIISHLFNDQIMLVIISAILIFHIITIFIRSVILEKRYQKKSKNLFYREELFNSLCTTVDDVFLIYDLINREYEYISPNIERILGLSGKAYRDNPYALSDFTDQDIKSKIESYFTTDYLNSYFEAECEFRSKITNQISWLALRIYPVMKNLKIVRYVICISDLTKLKQSQQLLKNALENAQKANEAKKEFLSHMSHELRTPINSIVGMAQIALNSIEEKVKVISCLDKITASSKNLLEIINNILDMAKIDSNKLKLSSKPFQIQEFTDSFTSIARTQAEINKQEFNMVLTDIKDDYLIGDSLRLEQILSNCISNSFKFTPSGGKIKLEICEIEKHVNKALFRFTITDNGKGMSEDFIQRLFIPFEQEDNSTTRKYEGTGLGMSITKNLVTLMGGNIHVSSKLGIGTVVTVDIVFEIPNKPSEEPVLHKESMPVYDFTGHRILVVEDNAINLEITCELLKYVKATVEQATNGYEALGLFKASEKGHYDAILMDVQMPGLNGYETAKAIRASEHPDADKVTIIAMSADTSVEDVSINMDCSINYHVVKPFDINYLYSLLQRVFTLL